MVNLVSIFPSLCSVSVVSRSQTVRIASCHLRRGGDADLCAKADDWKLWVSARVPAIWTPPPASLCFPSSSENMPAGLITGTDPGWRCMPLHMAAQIKMSPAACLSNSLALCLGLSQELQPDLSIWCSQHGGRPVYWHQLLPELTEVNKRVAQNAHVWPLNTNSLFSRPKDAKQPSEELYTIWGRGGREVNPIRTAALCDSWTHVSGSF